jgi:hypothetical protein
MYKDSSVRTHSRARRIPKIRKPSIATIAAIELRRRDTAIHVQRRSVTSNMTQRGR